MRLILLAILLYVLYKVVKGFLWKGPAQFQDTSRGGGDVSEMVQDPFCKTFVHVKDAQRRLIGGKEYFFCSTECADKFIKKHKEGA